MEQSENFPIISIDTEKKRFDDFLSPPDNERIIFSGIFGSGKTYFLKQFFERNENYICLHLYPVNYSVSKNEDIFEYIKYDILYELLSHSPYLEKIELSTLDALSYIDRNDYFEIVKPLIEMIPEIGKTITGVVEAIDKLENEVNKKKKVTDEGTAIKALIKRFESKPGGLYENDFYTKLISGLVNQLKSGNGKKREVVLILDDLDRIDPDHIFRILNILAVHFKNEKVYEYENKFNLDKIILSCDSENVYSIFSAKYGVDADFNGYIDKFYSKEIYHFNNKIFVRKIVEQVILSIISHPYYLSLIKENIINILQSMIDSNTLSIRTLKRLYRKTLSQSEFSFRIITQRIRKSDIPILKLFDFLLLIFGNFDNTIFNLQKTKFSFYNEMESLFTDLLMIQEYKTHNFISNKQHTFKNLKYEIKYDHTYRISWENQDIAYGTIRSLITSEFQETLINALLSYKYLKGIEQPS